MLLPKLKGFYPLNSVNHLQLNMPSAYFFIIIIIIIIIEEVMNNGRSLFFIFSVKELWRPFSFIRKCLLFISLLTPTCIAWFNHR